MPDWTMPAGLPSTWAHADCEAHIRSLADAGRFIDWSSHWDRRERDITKGEALTVLRRGNLTKVSAAEPPFTGVKCCMTFGLVDGPTTVVVQLSDGCHFPEPFLMI